MTKLVAIPCLQNLLFAVLFLFAEMSFGQMDTAYFNNDWLSSSSEDAKYYRVMKEIDTLLEVTDYYVKRGVQSTGFVENSPLNRKLLKIRGDFEQKTIGE